LLLRVASSARAYLLVITSISADVLWVFMASLWIKDCSMHPFLKNMMMDLLWMNGIMFLLLQKHWMNS
jgi:hypothetical protein